MDLTNLSAGRIARLVGGGEVSAVEVAQAHLDKIEAGESLNAFTSVDRARVEAAAAAVDAAVASGADPGPLAGVPVALKDLIDQEGVDTTCGSGFFRRTADESATVVKRIETAGGVIVGRTGLHEFAFGFSSDNDWFGPVRNPWDPEISPGGSSGGSAAAVAAGMAALGVGTDTGGSVRVPAALCGLAGLKVSHGRVPLTGVFPLAASIDTVGPMARDTADLSLLYRVMAGDDPADPWSSPRAVAVPERPVPLRGMRVAVPAEWLDTSLDPSTRLGFERARASMESAGVEIDEISTPLLRPTPMIAHSFGPEVAAVHRGWYSADPSRYGPAIRERMASVFETDPDEYQAALAWRSELRGAFARLFDSYDLVATPTVAARRKEIGSETADTEEGPVPYRSAFSRFTPLANHASVPAVTLPIDADGEPPPALQLIGPMWSEALLLGVGRALEEAGISGARRPPA